MDREENYYKCFINYINFLDFSFFFLYFLVNGELVVCFMYLV